MNRRFDREQADFISCIAWRQTAEFVSKYFNKGSMIAVVGSLQTGSYEKDGQTHYTTDVNVDEVYFTGSKAESSGSNNASNGSDPFPNLPPEVDDDLPF